MKNTLLVILSLATITLGADKFFGKKPEDLKSYLKQIADMKNTVQELSQGICK